MPDLPYKVDENGEPVSNLVRHAKYELELLGEEKETVDGYLRVIQAFADMGHSGGSASIAIPVINELLSWRNLTDLTNNPSEWMDVGGPAGEPLHQSRRRADAFSKDGGVTYYTLEKGRNIIYTSVPWHPEGASDG